MGCIFTKVCFDDSDLLAENDSLNRNNYSSHSKVLTKGASVKLLSPHQKNSRSKEESQHQEDESIYYGGGVPGTALSAEEADSCLYSSARSEGYISLSGELRWGSRTRSGNDPLKRRKENQDSLCVADGLLENKSITLFTVFDGHGPQGAFASHFVRNEYHHCLSETLQELARSSIKQNNNNSQETYKFSTSNLGQLIPESLRQASKRVNEKLMHQSSIDVTVSGSTCVSLLVCDQQTFLANVGDSRAIFAQYSSVEHAYSIVAQTKDHKPDIPEEKERIEAKNGRVFEWGTFRVWLKDIDMPGLAMSRSFGDAVAKTIGVTCEPDIFPVETLVKGDNNQDYPNFAVLASDGLWEFMATDEVVEFVSACIISSQKSPQETCDLLVKEALDRWNEEEDIVDDISVIVVYF